MAIVYAERRRVPHEKFAHEPIRGRRFAETRRNALKGIKLFLSRATMETNPERKAEFLDQVRLRKEELKRLVSLRRRLHR